MKRAWRCAFAALIGLGLLSQVIRDQRSGDQPAPMDRLAAALETLHVQSKPMDDGRVLVGQIPGCESPLYVTLLRVDGAEDENLAGIRPDQTRTLYVFDGRVSEDRARTATLLRAAWDSALFILRLRAHRPAPDVVAIAIPAACPALLTRDWARLAPAD